jgi:hypothetical protein
MQFLSATDGHGLTRICKPAPAPKAYRSPHRVPAQWVAVRIVS